MCLGELGRVVALPDEGSADVATDVRELRVSLLTLPTPVELGDWLLVHSGFALQRVEPDAAEEAQRLRRTGRRPGDQKSW